MPKKTLEHVPGCPAPDTPSAQSRPTKPLGCLAGRPSKCVLVSLELFPVRPLPSELRDSVTSLTAHSHLEKAGLHNDLKRASTLSAWSGSRHTQARGASLDGTN
eukprot:654650-Amphidinium_carterae.1